MKKFAIILFAFILGGFGFLILNKQFALTSLNIPLFSAPSGKVRIDFVNKSDEKIKSIFLSTSSEKIENIQIGDRKIVTFKHSGEGTYQFIVNFESGNELKIKERYIEGGYFLTENIYNDKVKTKY